MILLRMIVMILRAGIFMDTVSKPLLGENFLEKFHIELLLSASRKADFPGFSRLCFSSSILLLPFFFGRCYVIHVFSLGTM